MGNKLNFAHFSLDIVYIESRVRLQVICLILAIDGSIAFLEPIHGASMLVRWHIDSGALYLIEKSIGIITIICISFET